jgi:type IV pilus assembly protein PilM
MTRIGVGIDIGHGFLKIIQITKNKQQLELTGYAKINIPSAAIDDDGLIINEAVIIEAIRQGFLQARIKFKKVIIAVAGNTLTIKNLNLPVMLGPELGEVIRFEVEKFLSFPISGAEYDWDILRQQDNGEMELMIVAVPKKVIADQLTCLQRADLQVLAVDAQPFANMRALEFGIDGAASDFGGVVLLDMGFAMTQMTIYYDGSARETRIINTAGDLITRAIADQLQISYEKAEAIKCNLGDADYDFIESDIDTESYRANQIIGQKLTELIVEIRRSVEYFKLQFPGTSIQQFILTGGSSKLRKLAPHFQHELGTAVRLGDPLTSLPLNSKQINRAVLLSNPYQFSVAIGLAIRGVEC